MIQIEKTRKDVLDDLRMRHQKSTEKGLTFFEFVRKHFPQHFGLLEGKDLPVPVLAETSSVTINGETTLRKAGEARESTTKESRNRSESGKLDSRGGHTFSEKTKARKKRWRDKNPDYMKQWRAEQKLKKAQLTEGR